MRTGGGQHKVEGRPWKVMLGLSGGQKFLDAPAHGWDLSVISIAHFTKQSLVLDARTAEALAEHRESNEGPFAGLL